jgi:hypothetical protein
MQELENSLKEGLSTVEFEVRDLATAQKARPRAHLAVVKSPL